MPKVAIPPRYRGPTGGLGLIEVDADTVRMCIEAIEAQHPGFRELILDGESRIRRFVRLFLNGEALDRNAVDTPVTDSDLIQILASAAGG
jgi:predicted phage tail protein